MSDYNGPFQPVRVRFNRDWGPFKSGEIHAGFFYPELGSYMIDSPRGGSQSVGTHPTHEGLITRCWTGGTVQP